MGVPEEAIPIVMASISEGTLNQYDTCYRKWWDFCKKLNLDPLTTLKSHLTFFKEQMDNELSYSNIKKVLERVYNIRPPKPKSVHLGSTTSIVIFEGPQSPGFSKLELLTKKLVMLLALSSGHKQENQNVRKNKLQPILTLPFIKECPELCVASVLEFYHYKSRRYSTRHAATSAAFRSEINIDTIRNCAGWTETFDVFHKFYNRPVTENRIEFAKALLRAD
nr:unnamed protein product [Callosobruchus chinensis]CAH7754783.1 unnamed protein product [Callosobruchus chinensis]